MEAPATPGNASSSSDNICNSPTYGIQAAASNIIQGPLTGLLEYSGILGGGGGAGSSNSPDTEYLQVVSNESFPVEVGGGGGGTRRTRTRTRRSPSGLLVQSTSISLLINTFPQIQHMYRYRISLILQAPEATMSSASSAG
jgi:hypothetical protein